MQRYIDYYASPLGVMEISVIDDKLQHLVFCGHQQFVKNSNPLTDAIKQQLEGYFSGTLAVFDCAFSLQGTVFQTAVWQQLMHIPFGHSQSYQMIANNIGKPSAVRAVGAAVGRNPISIIIPCHRVIGTSGKLTGYAGGLLRKQWLLHHEGGNYSKPDNIASVYNDRQDKTKFLAANQTMVN